MPKQTKTSWEGSAEWYDEYLTGPDTYQEKVILPNLLRVLALKKGERVLDLACGQGYFAKHLLESGAEVIGVDASPSLIDKAHLNVPSATFHVADATKLSFPDHSFDVVICILALQNIENLLSTLKEVRRVLKPEGRFFFVVNHPAFRVPKHSEWGWDERNKTQYRRVERYLTPQKVKIEMHPGADTSYTWTFHRSLQDFTKALRAADFAVTRMEEWISHKKSQKGPRAEGEDQARKEIPLFLAVECVPR
ncbi:MAG: methyltransferase domain-containing protein [Parcubacteria group bacterium]|nr:methyltransferase domain-containing protein [Parcubacteria group bacterium]